MKQSSDRSGARNKMDARNLCFLYLPRWSRSEHYIWRNVVFGRDSWTVAIAPGIVLQMKTNTKLFFLEDCSALTVLAQWGHLRKRTLSRLGVWIFSVILRGGTGYGKSRDMPDARRIYPMPRMIVSIRVENLTLDRPLRVLSAECLLFVNREFFSLCGVIQIKRGMLKR